MTLAQLAYLTQLLTAACPGVTGTDGSTIWYSQAGVTPSCAAAAQTVLTNFNTQLASNPALAAPNPTTIPTAVFLQRFPQGTLPAIWKAAQADTTGTIGGGLLDIQSGVTVNLTASNVTAWMAAVVAAGALTQAQATTILTP